jgi:bacillopeptidase F
VDLYSPIGLYQQVVFDQSGLAPGAHTITITVTGTSNPAAEGTYIGADAFEAEGVPPLVSLARYEQTSANVWSSGTWTTWPNASLSGGSEMYSNTTGNAVSLEFTGTRIKWITARFWNRGIASVSIDGTSYGTVDLYSPIGLYQQVVFSRLGLASGSHTVSVVVTGTGNASATGTYIGADAFEGEGI